MDRPVFCHNPYLNESATARVPSRLNPSAPSRSDIQRTRPQSLSTAIPAHSSSLSASLFAESESSSFLQRTRSRSTGHVVESVWKHAMNTTASPTSTASDHWWKSESRLRPWTDSAKSKHPIPVEHQEAYQTTKQRVMKVANSILGTSLQVGHEALALSTDLLEFAPIPGLQAVARTLLMIWDSLQLVDMNRSACLRLTERCAEILLSIHQEIEDAGDQVGDELKYPMQKLSEAFKTVHAFLKREAVRPFLKRYLRRDESRREIASCDNLLHEALSMFSLSIQVRLLKQVQNAEKDRQRDTQTILDAIKRSSITTQVDNNVLGLSGIHEEGSSGSLTPRLQQFQGLPPSSSHASLQSGSVTPLASPSILFDYPKSHLSPELAQPRSSSSSLTINSPSETVLTLDNIRNKQNEYDTALDMADLRSILRAALSSGSDVEMLETLGISRDDMPEAIKTLQRALEAIVERQGSAIIQQIPMPVVKEEPLAYKGKESTGTGRHKLIKIARRISVSSSTDLGKVARSRMISTVSTSVIAESRPTRSEASESAVTEPDTLDREFIETGIDALRRMSRGTELNLPSWTITRFEVDTDERIGFGGFSDVYKGTWRGRTVAVKILSPTTPRNLFVREVAIWKTLRHPNVLELNGASSTSSDPPWFFVSPYEKHGNLTEYLRQVETGRIRTSSLPEFRYSMNAISSLSRTNEDILSIPHAHSRVRSGSGSLEAVEYDTKGLDLLKIMHQIAKGMQYLHENNVLHGDLKAANILVNNEFNCVISDFGQSELRSEVYRISGTSPAKGTTLRWQAPEVMMGLSELTPQVDVYAFAMTCVEILSMGKVPWSLVGDETVRHFVLKENSRPLIPITPFTKPGEPQILQELLRLCWHRDAAIRPDFDTIVSDLKKIRLNEGVPEDVISPKLPEWELPLQGDTYYHGTASPDLHPTPFMAESPPQQFMLGAETPPLSSESMSFYRDGSTMIPIPPIMTTGPSTVRMSMPEPKPYVPSRPPSIAPSSAPSTQSEDDSLFNLIESDGYENSPPALNKILSDTRDERRYRLLLNHKFHPSLTLPLWNPSPVSLGAVGYLHKPDGSFVTLFNAIVPSKSPEGHHPHSLPSVHGYGTVSAQTSRYDQRNAAQRGIDAITGIFRRPDGPSTRYTHSLRAGHKTAFMYTESCSYKYLENLDASKKWFKATIDDILAIYGPTHSIQREDVFLVIGTLSASDYALFVSHNHPDGHARFNVLPPKSNMPWGVVKTDTDIVGGPSYHEPIPGGSVSNSKISRNGGKDVTLILARLRFKPDGAEPTSL